MQTHQNAVTCQVSTFKHINVSCIQIANRIFVWKQKQLQIKQAACTIQNCALVWCCASSKLYSINLDSHHTVELYQSASLVDPFIATKNSLVALCSEKELRILNFQTGVYVAVENIILIHVGLKWCANYQLIFDK